MQSPHAGRTPTDVRPLCPGVNSWPSRRRISQNGSIPARQLRTVAPAAGALRGRGLRQGRKGSGGTECCGDIIIAHDREACLAGAEPLCAALAVTWAKVAGGMGDAHAAAVRLTKSLYIYIVNIYLVEIKVMS